MKKEFSLAEQIAEQQKKREVESIEVRGICATIQAMKYPSFTNLEDLLLKFGYRLTKI